jgi:hypothetical protein
MDESFLEYKFPSLDILFKSWKIWFPRGQCNQTLDLVIPSVAEPHHFYATPAPGKNLDAAPAHTLLYSKAKFLK